MPKHQSVTKVAMLAMPRTPTAMPATPAAMLATKKSKRVSWEDNYPSIRDQGIQKTISQQPPKPEVRVHPPSKFKKALAAFHDAVLKRILLISPDLHTGAYLANFWVNDKGERIACNVGRVLYNADNDRGIVVSWSGPVRIDQPADMHNRVLDAFYALWKLELGGSGVHRKVYTSFQDLKENTGQLRLVVDPVNANDRIATYEALESAIRDCFSAASSREQLQAAVQDL